MRHLLKLITAFSILVASAAIGKKASKNGTVIIEDANSKATVDNNRSELTTNDEGKTGRQSCQMGNCKHLLENIERGGLVETIKGWGGGN